MGEVLKKFGRYFLLDRVAQGGMAEIYRARLAATDGAGRLLVIKRIQSGYGSNSEFVSMFKSEIKVTMGFNHPNIVQLYDFGEEQDQPFIAMEFVDGRNLRQFLSRFSEIKQTFPIDLAAYIIEQAAAGLQYAHAFKDKITGEPLQIIHRDISPQNILISYEGNVKVIDFGIAKATTNSEATRAGIIKGKPSYLSPEQISGDVLDPRCDIFSLGIVLWELLTGKKLFSGENDLAVLKLIESCVSHIKPPSTLNPKVPEDLDAIVMKSLTKNRDKRYQNAEEFKRALHKFVYGFNPDFSPGDLSYYAKDLFKNDIVEDRKRIQKLNDKAEQLLAGEVREAVATRDGSAKSVRNEDTTTVFEMGDAQKTQAQVQDRAKPSKARVEVEMDAPGIVASSGVVAPGPNSRPQTVSTQPIPPRPGERQIPRQKRRGGQGSNSKQVLAAIAASIALVVFGPSIGIKVPVLSDLVGGLVDNGQARLILQGNAKNVKIVINGQTVGHELPITVNAPTNREVKVLITSATGSFQEKVTLKKGESRTVAVDLIERLPASTVTTNTAPDTPVIGAHEGEILLHLNIVPGGQGSTVLVNGRPISIDHPIVAVPLDTSLDVQVDRVGYRGFHREFFLQSKQVVGLKEWPLDVELEPLKFGFLTVRTTPSSEARIMVEGRQWIKKTPFENEKFPVGTYDIHLVNEFLNMEKTWPKVTLSEGKAFAIDTRLDVVPPKKNGE